MNVDEISPKRALNLIQEGTHVFVDVREPYEVDEVAYDVNGLTIPLGEIEVRMDEFPKDKTVIIGCRSGKRSMNACMFLKMNGFENVLNLEGGIIGWIESECPTR